MRAPMMNQLRRSVAVYSMTTKSPKNNRDVPRSFWKTRTAVAPAHAHRSGPRSDQRGRVMPRTRGPARASVSRLETRKPAKNIAKRIFATSAGWNE